MVDDIGEAAVIARSGPGWVHEIKHDGYRMMVRRDGSGVPSAHHPVVLNRRNRLRPEIGHFCGDIRRPCSAFSVSEDIRSLSGLFLAPGLCIQKFRSRRLRFDGQ